MSLQQLIVIDVSVCTAFWFIAWLAISRRLFRGDFPLWVPLMGLVSGVLTTCGGGPP